MDGVVNQKGSGTGIILISLKCVTIEEYLRLSFLATNNKAEQKALRTSLNVVKKHSEARP